MNQDNKLGGSDYGICCTPKCPPCKREPIPPIAKFYEAPCTSTCLCMPRMCSIFGGHDLNAPGPDPKACSPRKSSRSSTNPNTLGSPVGVLQATISMKSTTANVHAHRYATTLLAFMKLHTTPESDWSEDTLDDLIREGQTLLAKQPDSQHTDESPAYIYSQMEGKVKRWHTIDDIDFEVELSEKMWFGPPPIGTEDGPPPDMTMDNLKVAMKKFFSKHRFCLIKVAGTYKMVWRSRGIYFVLDLYGRKLDDLETDKENGKAMLICLRALDNVIHLISNLSGIQPTDPFNLREMKIVKLIGKDGKTMSRDFGKREHQYQVINDDYAVLKADSHLLRNSTDPIRTRSALPVGVAALLAAKIDHPATWNEKILDKIICYGVNVCVCCWEQCLQAKMPIEIDRFPNRLKIAQFKAAFTLTPRKFTGTWKCVPNFKQSELESALISSFDAGDNNLLVQIDQNIYAVFKKNNFFYLFDPYRHRVEGLLEGGEEGAVIKKKATLRMFSSLEVLLKVFTQMLLETNRTTQFAVHVLKINNIELSSRKEGAPAQDEPILNADFEVKSLNETLCFEEDETKCKLDLAVDDEEEDDITSGIIQMDMRDRSETEESEEELEEEEGALEDFGDHESSSSDDGHRHGRDRRKKSRGRKQKGQGRDGDGSRGRSKKREGKEKGKKGKAKGDKTDKEKKGKGKSKERGKKDKDKENKKKKGKKGKMSGEDESEVEKVNKKGGKGKKEKNKSDKEMSEKEKAERDRKDKEKRHKDKENTDKEEADKDKADKDKADKEKADKEKADKDKDNDKDKDKDQDMDKDKDQDMDKDKDKDKDKHKDADKDKDKRTPSEILRDEERRRREGDDTLHKDVEGSDGRDGCYGPGDRYEKSGVQELSCRPNHYPGYSSVAYDMAVVGSESGTYESICKLLRAGFKCADRILTMTSWGNYVVFRGRSCHHKIYFLFDGCTCNVNRFRYLDLNCGTAGLLCFESLHDLICYIIDSQNIRGNLKKRRKKLVDEICRQYC
ncbi:PREDICTED: uncharacterized protein LOC108369882 [Rhagoletis zephyria]|uniref:uncharacterized protein LOC108369882 n=1 Tax=Rhagoletis zephyria TaxID=28612 RepID=UPI000811A1F5|nr:PREDICTED: uncharacterized protein LOC108369882 [Rhagoletis zephyria]